MREPFLRLATPRARRLGRERNVDLARIPGTGSGGRIVAADVIGLVDVPPAVGESIVLEAVVDRARLDALVDAANSFDPEAQLASTDYLVCLTIAALRLHPQLLRRDEGEFRVVQIGHDVVEYAVEDSIVSVRDLAAARRRIARSVQPVAAIYDFGERSIPRAVVALGDGASLAITFSRRDDDLGVTVSFRAIRDAAEVSAFLATLTLLLQEPAAAL